MYKKSLMRFAWALLIAIFVFNILAANNILISLNRQFVWLTTLVMLTISLGVIGVAVNNRPSGILIDRDNRISLSRLQLVVWSSVLISALTTAGLDNVFTQSNSPPLNIEIPPQIWALLGLGAFSATAAPVLNDKQRNDPNYRVAMVDGGVISRSDNATPNQRQMAQTEIASIVKKRLELTKQGGFTGRRYHNATPEDARWMNLITGDTEGAAEVDISRVQKLLFTLLLTIVYSAALWKEFDGSAAITAFPSVSDGFLVLLGVSHAAYLADKSASAT